jgi:uncharacterized oligopeptide transporter (OPT) family protein
MSSRLEHNTETTPLLRSQQQTQQEPGVHHSRSEQDQNSQQEQQEEHEPPSPASTRSFTPKALLTGLLIGTLLCHLNIYLGLLNGFSDELSLEAVLLGFVILQSCKLFFGTTFAPQENVLISTIAGAMGLMPSVAGVVSSLVAVEFLGRETMPPPGLMMMGEKEGRGWELDEGRIALWGIGVGLFALPFIMLFRKYFVDEADLPWPSAKAVGTLVKVVHGSSEKLAGREAMKRVSGADAEDDGAVEGETEEDVPEITEPEMDVGPRILLWSFAIASTLVSPS